MDVRYNEEEYYGARPVFGAAAPLLDQPEELPREEEREEALPRPKTVTRPRTKLRIPVFAVLGWAVVLALVTSLLLSYIELNTIAAETYSLNQEISELNEERTKLKIRYESTFKLDQIEEYATNILGMVPADSSQIVYLNDQAEDQAVVLGHDGSFSAKLKSILAALGEYFS